MSHFTPNEEKAARIDLACLTLTEAARRLRVDARQTEGLTPRMLYRLEQEVAQVWGYCIVADTPRMSDAPAMNHAEEPPPLAPPYAADVLPPVTVTGPGETICSLCQKLYTGALCPDPGCAPF